MGKYKYLANHIALFSVSNFVSKILVFLLVPFYTNILSTADYGIADVMQTTLLLLVPALTINMGEAALRFGIDQEKKRGEILRIGMKYVLRATLIILLPAGIASIFLPPYLMLLFALLFFTNSIYEFMILYLQGCEQVKLVVAGSVFSTIVLIGSNLLFLLVFRIGLTGYLLSQILSYGFSLLLMLYLGKRFLPEIFSLRSLRGSGQAEEKAFEQELLAYGKPMILYSTGAWVNNAADRYFVLLLCGAAANGLYGIAYKIPSVLTVFQRIFAQAWQMSATKSRDEEKSEEFYSDMYNIYLTFMLLGCSFLILIVKPLSQFMFRKDFFEAWRYVPPLLISVVFGAMTGFLGSICLAYKDSKAMGIATGIGAAVNVILNACLIPVLSAMGAAVATAVSYAVMYGMAFLFAGRYVRLQVKPLRDLPAFFLLLLQAAAMLLFKEGERLPALLSGVCFLLLVLLYFPFVKEILQKLRTSLFRGRAD